MGDLFASLINLYIYVLIGRLIFEYIRMFARNWRPTGLVLLIAEAIYTVTDPPLSALRRIIPPIRLGTVSLDLSFMVLILGLRILSAFLINH